MEGQTTRSGGQNDRETIMKTFKEFDNIDEACEECIFEHEQEGIYEAEYQGKKVKGFLDREKEKPSEKDIKEWASTESTMNKYRERFKEQWKAKLSEVVAKMIEKL